MAGSSQEKARGVSGPGAEVGGRHPSQERMWVLWSPRAPGRTFQTEGLTSEVASGWDRARCVPETLRSGVNKEESNGGVVRTAAFTPRVGEPSGVAELSSGSPWPVLSEDLWLLGGRRLAGLPGKLVQSSVGERTHPREQGLNSGCILKADLKNLLAGHVWDVGETGYARTREGSSSAACGTGSGGSVARDGGGSRPAPRARGVPAAAPRRADLPLQPGRPAWPLPTAVGLRGVGDESTARPFFSVLRTTTTALLLLMLRCPERVAQPRPGAVAEGRRILGGDQMFVDSSVVFHR